MTINLKMPDIRELKPRITVFGTGGAGGNAVNNMIASGLQGCEFVVANTDAQALTMSKAERIIQMGVQVTEGLGAGSQPEVGRAAAEEVIDEIRDHLSGAHMVFVTAGMGGGTGTGAAPVVARCAKEQGILTVGVVTKPFHFEGVRRMRVADQGIVELQKVVDTLLIIPNQNLFRVANEKTTFADAFALADEVLRSGVSCITDLMVKEGLINLDFADVRAVMREMGKAMMGTGEASGDKRALSAAELAIANPLIDDASMKGAKGLLISITGGRDLTLYEVDEAATRIREEVDQDANIIVGATFDETLDGVIRVSVVATGIDHAATAATPRPAAAGLRARACGSPRSPRDCAPISSGPPSGSSAASDRAADRRRAPALAACAGGDRECGQGRGGRRRAADHLGRGRDHPADPAETVAVPRTGCRRARRRSSRRHPARSSRPRRSGLPIAGRACRASTNCRCRHRISCAPSKARRRAGAGASGEAAHEPLAAARLRRPWRPPRGGSPGTAGGCASATAHAACTDAAAAGAARPAAASGAHRPAARAAAGAGVGICAGGPAPTHQGLDPHGRQAPVHNSPEDDQLDIPAFLRRQAN